MCSKAAKERCMEAICEVKSRRGYKHFFQRIDEGDQHPKTNKARKYFTRAIRK